MGSGARFGVIGRRAFVDKVGRTFAIANGKDLICLATEPLVSLEERPKLFDENISELIELFDACEQAAFDEPGDDPVVTSGPFVSLELVSLEDS